jgi:hypothetical protein
MPQVWWSRSESTWPSIQFAVYLTQLGEDSRSAMRSEQKGQKLTRFVTIQSWRKAQQKNHT